MATVPCRDGDRGQLSKARHVACFKTPLFISLTIMTRLSRHSVVRPSLAPPLLTDTRRSTMGSGAREDFATMPVEYMSRTLSRRLRRPGELGVALRCQEVREALCIGIARGGALPQLEQFRNLRKRLYMCEMGDSMVACAVAADRALSSMAGLRQLLSCVPRTGRASRHWGNGSFRRPGSNTTSVCRPRRDNGSCGQPNAQRG